MSRTLWTLLSVPLLVGSCAKESPEDSTPASPVDSSDSAPPLVDMDGDGVPAGEDCDDNNPDVYPGQTEICDGIDQNCNDVIDEGYEDVDSDGVSDCLDSEDCDELDNDGDGLVDEGLPDTDGDGLCDPLDLEECDELDNDGDGSVDEGFDGDLDGWSLCSDEDCDDEDDSIFPDAEETEDSVDNDCDGLIDEGDWAEGDLIITELMVNPAAVTDPNGEWIEIYNASGREVYLNGLRLTDGEDDDHAIDTDELLVLSPDSYAVLMRNGDPDQNGGAEGVYEYADFSMENEEDSLELWAGEQLLDSLSWDEGVTFPNPSGASMSLDPAYISHVDNDTGGLWCTAPESWEGGSDYGSPGEENPICPTLDRDNDGFTPDEGDCDDANNAIYPGAKEIPYDGVDNDCDESTLDDDLDQDGFVAADDCDDNDDGVYPGGTEICDPYDVDEDCDGLVDDDDPSVTGTYTFYVDDDADGFGNPVAPSLSLCDDPGGYSLDNTDCDDTRSDINPGESEIPYDGDDNDCDDATLDDDLDEDGFLGSEDCDDTDPDVNPDQIEICDDANQDEDCSGYADDLDPAAVGQIDWYVDNDGDGYGDESLPSVSACDDPGGYAPEYGDCDDSDPAYNPGEVDDCVLKADYDCNGFLGGDQDFDGFSACGEDCDDFNAHIHPYAYEDQTDGIDNDCDGYTDTADPETPTSIRLSDDSTSSISFTGGFTFEMCGTSYSSATVSSNGFVFLSGSTTSYSESLSSLYSYTGMAVLWDDLNPSYGGTVEWIQYADAVGVYYRDIAEYGASSRINTASLVMMGDGRVVLDYEDVNIVDGVVGWSCGYSSGTSADMTFEAQNIPEGSLGIGNGTDYAMGEQFTSVNDLEGTTLTFCIQQGTDGDGDGWTDDCGDPDDADPLISP